MKKIKFRSELAELIIMGKKTSTWRLFDDKDLCVGDKVVFAIWEDGKEFAHAKLTRVSSKTLGTLKNEDLDGHEKIISDEEMYKTFEKFYNQTVDKDSPVKIITFEIIEFL